ncbi:PfkB family carbohydrate kinase [Nakamurella deserti]|uniref:PfkB family carbohydrate kinase n=1 Tax=Nakamurella deserti TaxID=2164074 RepID=UPI000DBE8C6B|nr:PfkB family carbohydrate kinase [Nakamurella deserti]
MHLVAVGDNITDCYPEQGVMFPGGNCVNVAVHSARAGAPTSYVGAVGTDERGTLLRDELTAESVDVSRLRTLPGETGYATVFHVDGDRHFGPFDRGVAEITLSEEDLRFIATHRIAHSSTAAQLTSQVPELAARVPVSFDFDVHTADAYCQDLIGSVTHAFFSASHLSESEALDLLAWACDRGASTALATRGSSGAVFSDGRTVLRQPAVASRVEDTLGAGDAFIGVVLAGLIRERPADEFLADAARASAAVCERFGAFGPARALPAALHFPRPSVHVS